MRRKLLLLSDKTLQLYGCAVKKDGLFFSSAAQTSYASLHKRDTIEGPFGTILFLMFEGTQGALFWASMMPRSSSLSDSCTPDCCRNSSRWHTAKFRQNFANYLFKFVCLSNKINVSLVERCYCYTHIHMYVCIWYTWYTHVTLYNKVTCV